MYQGSGVYKFKNGRKYVGQLKNEMMDGEGVMKNGDGTIQY